MISSKKIVLIVISLTSFLTPFLGSAVNIALPVIGKEFKLIPTMLSWVTISYFLAAAVFLVIFGRVADLWGRKKVFLSGVIIFSLASLLTGFAFNPVWLILGRALQGIGSTMIFVTGLAILTSVFSTRQRGKVLGLNMAAVYFGLSIGPSLGGYLIQYWGWRSLFLVSIPLGILVIILTVFGIKKEWIGDAGEKFDWIGSFIYSGALVSLISGFFKLPSLLGVWMTGTGLFSLVIFVLVESRAEFPILKVRLFFKNRRFLLANLTALLNYSASFAVSYLLSIYLQNIAGLEPQKTGFYLLIQPIMLSVISPWAGWLSDRFPPRKLIAIGMTATAAGLTLLIFLNQTINLLVLISAQILFGFGLAFFAAPNTKVIFSVIKKNQYGEASGILGIMRLLGQMLSMGITILTFNLVINGVASKPVLMLNSIKIAFYLFLTLCLCGVYIAALKMKEGNIRKKQNITGVKTTKSLR